MFQSLGWVGVLFNSETKKKTILTLRLRCCQVIRQGSPETKRIHNLHNLVRDVPPVCTPPKLYALTVLILMKNHLTKPLYLLQHELRNIFINCIPHVMCFNVSDEYDSKFYLEALSCTGNEATFAKNHELIDGTGLLLIVCCFRVENVFGYTVNNFYELYRNRINDESVRVGTGSPERIYIEHTLHRQRQMRSRPAQYLVELSMCRNGPVDGPNILLRKVFSKLAESGMSKTGLYHVAPTRYGRKPNHFTWILGTKMPISSTLSTAKIMKQILSDVLGTYKLVCNVR